MKWIKQLFCKHKYKKVAKRRSDYVSDYIHFSDLGFYNDVAYCCEKCGKKKYTIEQNENHPLYRKWEIIEEE